ncbi:streptococcal hemagglutinin-like isoform X2 [Littorina saxatilis]|uniref:streptococcal hemagglutinin-like isoform X2 n=1 Tax=Littorina saxatilis TaxID=31220 RepID=UPI0038B67464
MHSNMTETSGQCHVSPRPLPLGKVRNPRPGPLDTAKRTEPASVTRTETSPREPIMYSGTLTVDTRKDSGPQNLDREFDKIHRQFEEKGHLPPPSHMSMEKPALPGFMDGLEKSRNFVEEPQLAKEASLADEQRPLESAKTPDIGLLGPPSTPPHLEREVMEPCERGGQMDGSGDADQLPLPSLVREDDVGDVVGGVEKIKWDLTNGASSHHGHGVNKSDSVKSKLKPHWSIKKDRPRKNVVKNFLSSTPTETTNSSIFLKYFGDRNPTVNMRHLQGEFKDALRRIPLVVLRRLSPNAVRKHAPQSRVSKSATRQDKYEELTVSVDDAHSADVTERPSMNGEHKQARTEKEKSRKQEKISPLTEMLEQSKVWGDAKRTLSSSVKDSSKTADSVPSGRRLDVNSNNQIDMESHSLFSCDLVDPKVASLSKTLRLACSNGKAADQIAFKKKKVGILGPPSPKPRSASSRPGSRSPKPGAKKAQPFIVDRLKLQLKLQDNQTKTSHTANTAYTAHSSSALKMSFIAKSKSSTSSADDRLGGRSFSGLSADVPCKEPSLDGWESRPDVIFDCGGPATKKFPTQNERIAVSSEGDRGRWKTGAQAQKSTRVEEVAELPKPNDSLSNQAHLSNAGILMINTNATACRTLPSKLSPARQRAYFRSVSDEGDDGKGVGAEYRDIELATVSVKLDPCLCSAKTSPVLGEAFTATAELADSVKIASQAEEVIDTKVPLSAGEACLIQVFSGTGETVVVKGFPTTVGAGESGAGVTKESFVLEQPVLAVTKEEEQEPAAATTEEFQIGEFISSTFDVVEEQVSTSEELTEGSSVSQDVITTTSITTLTCEDQISGGLLLADFQDEIVGEIEITQDEGEDVDEVFQIVNERDVPIPHEAFLQSLDLLRETERLGTDSEKASPARFSRSASPVEGSVRTSPLRESGLPSSVGQSLNSSSPARESVFMSLADKGLLDMPLSAEKSVGRKAWLKDDGIEYDVLTTKTTKDSRVGEENEDSDATLPYPRDEHDARTKKPKKSRARRSRKKTSKKASNEKNKAKPSSKPQPPRVETSPGKKNYPKRGRTTKSYNKLEEFSPIIPTTRREKKQKGNNSKGAAKRHPLFKKRNQSATKQPRPKQKTKAKASETKPKTSTSPLKLTIPTTSGTPSTPTTTSTTSTSSIPLASSSTPLPAKPGDSVYYFSDSSTDSPLENLPPKQFFSDQLPRPKSVPATKRSPAKKRTSGKGRSTIAIESVPETTTAKRRSRPGQGKRKQPKSAEGKTPSEEKARLSVALFGATTLTDEDSESDELPTILPPKRRRQQLQQQQEQQQQQQLQHNQQQQLPHSRSSATTTTTTAAAEALASSQAAAEVAADMQERSMVDPQGSDRIMREFPRHNWLQYKILHTPTTSYTPPSASAGLASLSPPPASFAPLNSADLALALPSSTHLNPPVAEGVGEGLDLRAGRSSSRNSRNGSPERAQGADWTGEKLSSVANARNSSTKHRASGDDSNLTVSSADKSSKTGQASEEAACVTAFDGLSAKELEASSAITSVRGAVSLAIIPGSTPPPPVLVPRAGQPGNPAPGHAFSFTRPITDLIAANPAPPLPVSYTPRTPLFVRPDVANSSNSSSGVSGNPAPDGFLSARGVSVDSHPAQTVAENSRRVEEGSKGAVDLSGKGEQSSRQRRGGASVVPLSHPPPLRPFAPPPGLARGTSLTGHLLVPFTFVVEGSKYPHHQPHLLPRVPHVPHRAPRPRSSARRPKNIQPKMPSSQNSSTSDDLSPRSLQIDLREDPVASVPEIALDNQHRKAPAKLSKSSVHYSGSTQGEQSGNLSQCSLPSPLQRSRSSEALLVGSNSGESRDPGTATAGGRRKSWEQARKDAMEEEDEVEVTLVEHGTRDITARTMTATTASVLTATTSTATASTTPATATTTASVVPAVPMLVPVDSNPQLREMAADATARSRPLLGPPPSLIPTATVSDGKEGVEDPLAVGRGSFELDQSGGDGGAPLDLCIKKTDMLTGSRMRANLPVQLVLPQVQPRTTSTATTSTPTTTSTSTPLSAPSPDDIIADTKRALKEIQVVIATTSSATAESSAFTTSLISTAEDVGVTLTNSGGGVVSTPQTVPSLLSSQGGGVVTVGVGVTSDVRGADTGVARAGATIAQPWPSVNAAGACVRLDEQSQQTEVQAARNMTVSAENTADLPNDLPMESQASLAPADAAEEERLRHQLRKLVELAARKEQERERLLMLHKRKAEILMEMESKRRRMGNTSTMATTSNQLPHLDTLLTGSHSTHSWHDSGEHNTSTSTSGVGGAAESRPGPRRFEVLQQAKAIALAAVDRSANSDRLNGPTQGPSSADGSVLDLSRPASQDSSSGTSERGPLVHMISQAIQDWGKQKPGRPSDGEDAGPSENDGRGQAGGGAIRSAHQAPKDNCSPLHKLGPSPSRAPCFLRRKPVHEPPVPRSTHSTEAIPQSAHMQRPFQLAGSWIVPADRLGKAQIAERAHAASRNRAAATGQATAIEKAHERGQLDPGERATQKSLPSDRNLQGARGSASVPREVIDLTREQREGLRPSAQGGAGPTQEGCGVRGEGDPESSVQADLAVAVARSHKQASGGGGAGEGPLTDGQLTGRAPQLLPVRPANVHLVPGPGADFEAAGAARFPPSSTRRSHGQPHPQLQPQPHPGLQPARDAMFHALQQQQQGIMMDKTSMAALQQRPSRMHAFPAYPDPRLVPTSTSLMNAAALRHPTALGMQRMPVSSVMQRDGRGMDVHPTYPMGRHPASAINTHFPALSQQGEEQNLVLRNPMEDPPAPRQSSRMMPIAPKSSENVNTAMMQQQQLQRQAAAENMHLQQEAALHMQQHHQLLANHQQQQHMQQYPQHGSQKSLPGHPSSRSMQVTHPHSNGPTYPPLSSAPTSDAHVVPMSMTVAAGAGGGPIMSRGASGYYSHAMRVGRGGEMVVQPVTSAPAPSSTSSSSSASVTQRVMPHDVMVRMLQMQAGGRPPFYPPPGPQPGAMDPNLVRGDPYSSASAPYPHHLPGHPLQPGASHPVMMHPRMTSGEGASHSVKASRQQQQHQQHLQQHQQQHHQHQQTLRKPEGMCEFCGAAAMYLCSKCRAVWYCSQPCQTSHWTTHGSKCKAKSKQVNKNGTA